MKFIGITGGIGAGKSETLSILERQPKTRVLLADRVAHLLMEPGEDCYLQIKECFPNPELYSPDGSFDRNALARFLFADPAHQEKINSIVHPAVKTYVLKQVEEEKQKGELDWFFFEAALLLEEHYDEICDELWYIYTEEKIRIARLMSSRGYSEEKCRSIIAKQKAEEEFRRVCKRIISNNGSVEELEKEIKNTLKTAGEISHE